MKQKLFIIAAMLCSISSIAQNAPRIEQLESRIIEKAVKGPSGHWLVTENLYDSYDQRIEKWDRIGEQLVDSFSIKLPGNAEIMHEDSNGALWIGTGYGLVYYNGDTVMVFDESNSALQSDDITAINSNANDVWVGTDGGGAYLFNGVNITDSIYSEFSYVYYFEVASIEFDNNGNVWIGNSDYSSDYALLKYDGDTVIFYGPEKGLSESRIFDIAKTSDGTLWFAVPYAGVCTYDATNDTIITYGLEKGIADNYTYSLAVDHNDTLWIGTDEGLSIYDAGADTIINFTEEDGFIKQRVENILPLGNGIAFEYGNGFAVYNQAEFAYYDTILPTPQPDRKFIFVENDSLFHISKKYGYSIYHKGELSLNITELRPNRSTFAGEDLNGNIWYAFQDDYLVMKDTQGNFNYFPYLFDHEYPYKNYATYDLANLPNGDTWLAAEYGIIKWDGSTARSIIGGNSTWLPEGKVFDIEIGIDSTIWVGTEAGLIAIKGNDTTNYTTDDGFYANGIQGIKSLPNGNIVVATQEGSYYGEDSVGISIFNGQEWEHITPGNLPPLREFRSITSDTDGNIWITGSDGEALLVMYNGTEWIDKTNILPEGEFEDSYYEWIEDIVFDSNENLWIIRGYSGYAKLYRYDWKDWETFGEEIFGNAQIWNMTIDSEDNIYVATDSKSVFYVIQPPKINFTADTACFGQPTTLTAEANEVFEYRWEMLDADTTLIGTGAELAYTFPAAGTFTVRLSITTANDSNWIEKPVLVYETPVPTIQTSDADSTICAGEQIGLSVFEFASIQWNTGSDAYLILTDTSGDYSVTVSNELGCYNEDTIHIKVVNLPEFEIASSDGDNIICLGETVELSAPDYAAYAWNTGDASQNINVDTSGTFSVSVTDAYGCKGSAEMTLSVKKPFEEQIGVVTASEVDDKLIVAWERTADVGTKQYNIYRLEPDGYELIATQDFTDPGYYFDTEANYKERSYSYKLTTTDQCGNESDLDKSIAHASMHLLMIPQGESYQLLWSKYEGIDQVKYTVYETNKDGSDTVRLASLPSVNTTYTVLNYNPEKVYRVAVNTGRIIDPSALKNDSGPFSQSLSNLSEAIIESTITAAKAGEVQVYPLPADSQLNIAVDAAAEQPFSARLLNTAGSLILETQFQGTEGILQTENIQAGLYILEVSVNGSVSAIPVIIE